MNYLAIDTTGDLVVLLNIEGKITKRYLKGNQTKHSLTLMPYVQEILNETNKSVDDLDFFVVVVGPGSFTGIRIGVATIQALCFATNKKAMVLTSFDCIAYDNNVPQKRLCLVDANHDNFYSAGYENAQNVIKPCFLSREQICAEYADYSICCAESCGFSGEILCDKVRGLINAIELNRDNLVEPNKILPLYVKKSQAEEENC